MKIFKTAMLGAALTLASSAAGAGVIFDFVALTENSAADGGLGESAWDVTTGLNLNSGGIGLGIIGVSQRFESDGTPVPGGTDDAFAYLDNRHAGLGVCRNLKSLADSGKSVNTAYPGNGGNLCAPGSDDNVTGGALPAPSDQTFAETLLFQFDVNVVIERIWFNNSHDNPNDFIADDRIKIDGTDFGMLGNGYAPGSKYNAGGSNPVTGASVNNFVDDNGNGFGVLANDEFSIMYSNQQFYVSAMEVSAVRVPEPASMALVGLGLLGLGLARRRRSV